MLKYQLPFQVRAMEFKSTVSIDQRDILSIVTEELGTHYNINPELLKTDTRIADVKYMRWIIWKILHSHGISYERCGRAWGGEYNHSTVGHAIKTLRSDVKNSEKVREAYLKVIEYDNNPFTIAPASE